MDIYSEKTPLVEYMELSREERTAHIDLSCPCEFSSKFNSRTKYKARQRIAELLQISKTFKFGGKINLCHLCQNNSINGYCINPKHFYIGTSKENKQDALDANPELVEVYKEICLRNQPLASLASNSPEAIAKRKESYKLIGHQQKEKNSQFGTMWVTNGIDNKKVKSIDEIPEGFWPGRTLKNKGV